MRLNRGNERDHDLDGHPADREPLNATDSGVRRLDCVYGLITLLHSIDCYHIRVTTAKLLILIAVFFFTSIVSVDELPSHRLFTYQNHLVCN